MSYARLAKLQRRRVLLPDVSQLGLGAAAGLKLICSMYDPNFDYRLTQARCFGFIAKLVVIHGY